MTQAAPIPYYQIVVARSARSDLASSLAGLAISVREQPAQPVVTKLTGPLADQSALQGVLDTLFMLNMPLLLVERFPTGMMASR